MRPICTRCGFTLMEMLAVILLISTIIGFGVPAIFSREKQAAVQQAVNDLLTLHRRVVKLQLMAAAKGYITSLNTKYRITIYGINAPYKIGSNPNFGISFTAMNGQGFDASGRIVANVSPNNNSTDLWNLLKDEFGANEPENYNNSTTTSQTQVPDGPGGYYKFLDADGFIAAISINNLEASRYSNSAGNSYTGGGKDSSGAYYYNGVKPGFASYTLNTETAGIAQDNTTALNGSVPLTFTFRALPTGTAPPASAIPTFKINRVVDIYCQGYTDVK